MRGEARSSAPWFLPWRRRNAPHTGPALTGELIGFVRHEFTPARQQSSCAAEPLGETQRSSPAAPWGLALAGPFRAELQSGGQRPLGRPTLAQALWPFALGRRCAAGLRSLRSQ